MKILLTHYPELKPYEFQIKAALEAMIHTYECGGKILVCGNGGSAADCEHIVGELMKGFHMKRPVCDKRIPEELRKHLQGALPAISLPSQISVLSAFSNDADPQMMYAQLVYGYVSENDLVIGISTSGNSVNIVNAMTVAKSLGITTVALTGEKPSKLSELCDVTINVPSNETYRVQEYHLPIYHYLCTELEKYFFKEKCYE